MKWLRGVPRIRILEKVVVEKVVRVDLVVADEVPDAAVPAIGARFRNQVRDGSSAATILCRGVQAELLEFLDSLLDGHVVDTTTQALVGHPIDRKTVEVFA